MTTGFKIHYVLYLFTCLSYAQVEEIYRSQFSDSTIRFQGIIPPVEYQYNLDEFFTKPLFNQTVEDIFFEDNPSNIWLRTELLISRSFSQTEYGEVNTFFTAPLYQQYLRDSEFDMMKYILGTVQTGAVAYMAYRYIKKYGFWK